MQQTATKLRKGDWIRFQRKSNKMVLEGFVQEVSADGAKIKVGKAAYSNENSSFDLSEIQILRRQSH